jgi:hypothetical protein
LQVADAGDLPCNPFSIDHALDQIDRHAADLVSQHRLINWRRRRRNRRCGFAPVAFWRLPCDDGHTTGSTPPGSFDAASAGAVVRIAGEREAVGQGVVTRAGFEQSIPFRAPERPL